MQCVLLLRVFPFIYPLALITSLYKTGCSDTNVEKHTDNLDPQGRPDL